MVLNALLDGIGAVVADLIRSLFVMLDTALYSFAGSIYNLLLEIASTSIFSENIFTEFASNIYALLGIFMLFKVSFSILSYIVNPDEFADKSKGFSKLISNIVITLTLLLITPWIFTQAMELQRIILQDDVIGKIFTSIGSNENTLSYSANAGRNMSYDILRAFYHFDENAYPGCEGLNTGTANQTNCLNDLEEPKLGITTDEFLKLNENLEIAFKSKRIDIYLSQANLKDDDGNYVMSYTYLLSTVAGIVLVLILAVLCFDVALRSIKLGFYRLIAPIPIISRVDPKKGTEMFKKWSQNFVSTYLDLFIRLVGIYFAVFIISNLDSNMYNIATGVEEEVDFLVRVFIIFGALMFAKQLPQILKDLTGVDLGGKFTLNPFKKLAEVPGVEKMTSVAGGAFAGNRAGARAGNAVLGTVMGIGSGWKNSKIMGDGKAGFTTTLQSTYKKMTGQDFANFQWKPGGVEAVKKIGDPLGQLYQMQIANNQKMTDVRLSTEKSANSLIGNGVSLSDVNEANIQKAQNELNSYEALNNEIKSYREKVGTPDYDEEHMKHLETKMGGMRLTFDYNSALVSEGRNYMLAREQEMDLKDLASKIDKDISTLQKEKSQRESFYGIDPAPTGKVDEAIERATGKKTYESRTKK